MKNKEKRNSFYELTSTLTRRKDKNNWFSLKSALSLPGNKSKEPKKDPNISKPAEEHIYAVIDDSIKVKPDSMKERPRLLTPKDEIAVLLNSHPELRNSLSKIYFHEKYFVIKELLELFDKSVSKNEIAFKITLKNIINSLNIIEENEENKELLDPIVNSLLILSKHNIWDYFLIKDREGDYETINEEGCYELMSQLGAGKEKEPDYMNVNEANLIKNQEGDYETINEKGCYEFMSQIGEGKEKEPDYMNVKESNYMDMNKGKPSFFAANTRIEEEKEKVQQEKITDCTQYLLE